ncbi:MAG: hypothetical protein RL385_1709, partial [Pseudomonadota bacterium]
MPRAGHTLAVWSALVLSVGVTACDSEEFIDKPIGRDAAVQLP